MQADMPDPPGTSVCRLGSVRIMYVCAPATCLVAAAATHKACAVAAQHAPRSLVRGLQQPCEYAWNIRHG